MYCRSIPICSDVRKQQLTILPKTITFYTNTSTNTDTTNTFQFLAFHAQNLIIYPNFDITFWTLALHHSLYLLWSYGLSMYLCLHQCIQNMKTYMHYQYFPISYFVQYFTNMSQSLEFCNSSACQYNLYLKKVYRPPWYKYLYECKKPLKLQCINIYQFFNKILLFYPKYQNVNPCI